MNTPPDDQKRIFIDIEEIMALIPHRYPFLLVDRIVGYETGKNIIGIKNVTINEPYFSGHFPGHPIMPGVLIIEAMAQVGAVYVKLEPDGQSDKLIYFRKIERAKFRKPVFPGDCLKMKLELLQRKGVLWRFKGEASVDDEIVTTAELQASIIER